MTTPERVLGVSCTPSTMFLAIAEHGVVLDVEPQKVGVPGRLLHCADVRVLADELHRRLVEASPGAAALLQPTAYDGTLKGTTSRVGAETVFRLVAHDAGIEVELLNRATARSRLHLGAAGSLDSKIEELFPTPVGRYWSEGRRLAAFAALACRPGKS